MITKILELKINKNEDGSNYYTIYFTYNEKLRFTYLTESNLNSYWIKKRGLKGLVVGYDINVFEENDKIHFKIVSIDNK